MACQAQVQSAVGKHSDMLSLIREYTTQPMEEEQPITSQMPSSPVQEQEAV